MPNTFSNFLSVQWLGSDSASAAKHSGSPAVMGTWFDSDWTLFPAPRGRGNSEKDIDLCRKGEVTSTVGFPNVHVKMQWNRSQYLMTTARAVMTCVCTAAMRVSKLKRV